MVKQNFVQTKEIKIVSVHSDQNFGQRSKIIDQDLGQDQNIVVG